LFFLSSFFLASFSCSFLARGGKREPAGFCDCAGVSGQRERRREEDLFPFRFSLPHRFRSPSFRHSAHSLFLSLSPSLPSTNPTQLEQPKYIIYATYLSEKIGYWRYISIYRHLQRNPNLVTYPLFEYFENWCQDENRHGDFFAAVIKSKPGLIEGTQGRLWSRFFCLSVSCWSWRESSSS
jgi:hypothetical protein